MTKEQATQAAAVLQAYSEGKDIQWRSRSTSNPRWFNTSHDSATFNFDENEYRVAVDPRHERICQTFDQMTAAIFGQYGCSRYEDKDTATGLYTCVQCVGIVQDLDRYAEPYELGNENSIAILQAALYADCEKGAITYSLSILFFETNGFDHKHAYDLAHRCIMQHYPEAKAEEKTPASGEHRFTLL